jgi:hypothetical protein
VLEEAHERTEVVVVVMMMMMMMVTTMIMMYSYWHQTNYSCMYTEVIRHSPHSVVEYGASWLHVTVKTRNDLLAGRSTVMSTDVE